MPIETCILINSFKVLRYEELGNYVKDAFKRKIKSLRDHGNLKQRVVTTGE